MSQSLEFKIPKGYVFDKDNSTDEVIRFKPIKKKITYQDVKEKLFPESKASFYLGKEGGILQTFNIKYLSRESVLATSQQQLQQIRALNKLMNVAKYLNGDWEPDWRSKQEKYYIVYDYWKYVLTTTCTNSFQSTLVYFKSPALAKQAIEILGEEEVKKALGIFE